MVLASLFIASAAFERLACGILSLALSCDGPRYIYQCERRGEEGSLPAQFC
jgi:hypothetical protein